MARTLKLLGTIHSSLEMGDARGYLKKALAIFQIRGNKKQVAEIKSKLKVLKSIGGENKIFDVKIVEENDF